ncbi:MAG: hypothetical protein H7Y04_07290 [Verrucomicrobia bacterium]|nr:hypothetical protein [Cytophagales bacterium]
MALSVNLLQTQADCDLVLNELNESKETLDFNRLRFERSKDTATERATSLEADIAAALAEQSSLATIIASLPEGATKAEMQIRKTHTDYRLFQLELRKSASGTTAVILFESQIGETDGRLAVINASIAEVEARKAVI